MKLYLKIPVVLVLTQIIGIIVAFAGYDLLVFQPHRSRIAGLLQAADPEDRNPPEIIRTLVYREATGPSVQVARHLLTRFLSESEYRSGGSLGWHSRYAMWDLMVRLHLSKDEIIALYCSLAGHDAGKGKGMNVLSRHLYGRDLSRLTSAEAAALVVYLRAPVHYGRNSERLAEHSKELLRRGGGP